MPVELWSLVAAVGMLAIGVTTAALWRATDQRFRSVPFRRIADVKERERARVIGTVELDATAEAPLSGRECAFWVVFIERKGALDIWETVHAEQGGVDFDVRDESGRARIIVRPPHVEAVLDEDARYSSGPLDGADPAIEAFLASRGHTSKGWILNKRMRYREGIVGRGERVAVVGVGRWEPDPQSPAEADGGYRDQARPSRLVMREAGPTARLLVTDDLSIAAPPRPARGRSS